MDMRHWIAIAAIVLAVIAGLMLFSSPEEAEQSRPVAVTPEPIVEPDPEPEPESPLAPPVDLLPEPEPEPEAEPELEVVLPALNESDAFLRDQADVLTSDNAMERVLATEDLVRRFTMVVENLAEGNLARDPVAYLAPEGDFAVVRRNDTPHVNPETYRRYDSLTGIVTAIEPRQALALLELMQPLIGEAYAELGLQGVDVKERLALAIDTLLETPVVEGRIELTQPSVMYEFADEDLEALLPAQKQLIRMGPDNQRKIQAQLRRIRELL